MISINPSDRTRKDYLDSRGIPVARKDISVELMSNKPLLPVCLVVQPFYTQAVICLSQKDFDWVDGAMHVSKSWYLIDLKDVIEDFPQYAVAIQSARRGK